MEQLLKPNVASVEEQVARILASPQFRDSPRLQTFLRFVVSLTLADRANEIKESTIAAEVFGRADTPDDSIVRSAARRLRTRLEEYYADNSAPSPVRIVIPKGSYVPEIYSSPAPPMPDKASIVCKADRPDRRLAWGILAAGALALACCGAAAVLWRHGSETQRRNLEAQELYLKGRYYWSKRTPEALNRAVDCFTQAVVKDPGDARAYAGLADSYNLLSEYTVMPYQEAFKRAISAAQTAIALNGSLAEAHNSLAFASFYGAWDAFTAEREFNRALVLNPNYGTAHHWYATFLMSIGREHEALAEIERAQTLDPSAKSILADKGLILMNAGEVNAAQALLEEIAASDPQFLSPHRYLAEVYLLEKRYIDYLSESRKGALLSQDINGLAIVRAGEKGFAIGGASGMAEAMLRTQETSPQTDGQYYRLAQLCALLNEHSRAVQYLRLPLAGHDIHLAVLTVDPYFASLRREPEFQEIVNRVGLARQALAVARLAPE